MVIGIHRARNGADRIRVEGPFDGSSGRPVHTTESVPVIGAHGGCGSTTLAAYLGGGAAEAALELPLGTGGPGPTELAGLNGLGHTPLSVWRGRTMVVVGQGTAYGVKRAMDVAGELLSQGVGVVMAIVADGVLAEPVPVRSRARTMRGVVRAVVRVPYVARWRVEDLPTEAPPAYLAAVERIRVAIAVPR